MIAVRLDVISVRSPSQPVTKLERMANPVSCFFKRISFIEILHEGKTVDDLRIVRLGQESIKVLIRKMANNVLSTIAAHYSSTISLRPKLL